MVQIINGAPVYTVRIKFRKIGSLQYISHLDLVRTMSKIVVRTKLPLWYTEGFNPKPKMVFAAPLSIGTESLCEYLDLRITERIAESEIKDRFNANVTDEMRITEVYYPENPLTDLKWMAYTLKIKTNGADEALAKKCAEVLDAPKIEVMKRTKKGDNIVDIRPLIKSASVELLDGCINISTVLSSDSCEYLNPEYIIKVLKSECGILSDENLLNEGYSILREKAFCADMSDFR
jgi:radical SAM-linked protein